MADQDGKKQALKASQFGSGQVVAGLDQRRLAVQSSLRLRVNSARGPFTVSWLHALVALVVTARHAIASSKF